MKKCPYWTRARRSSLLRADSFAEVGMIAQSVLHSFPKREHGSIIQVCGPISTGGFNSVKLNFLVFADAVRLLRERGEAVFDQTPLEEGVSRIWERWKSDPKNSGYCWPILDEIYLPLFESNLIGRLFFLPGWENSIGTCWERARGLSLKLHIEPYPESLYRKIIESHGLTHP